MKKKKMTVIMILALCLMVLPASVASGAQSLTVNGQPVKSITLEVGQSCTVEVVSDDSRSYTDYVGFDNRVVLGTCLHVETMPAAGDSPAVTEYNERDFYGYYVVADGFKLPPGPGVHFVFEYEAQQVGETDLKLYQNDPPPFAGPLLDSVHITVIPASMGTAITYQGSLNDAGSPADGFYDFQFKLYDSITGGNQEGNTIDINDVDVIEGQFVVELDFGSDPNIFGGDARWLQIGVRPGDSNGVHTRLSPRIELMPTPYAIYAKNAGDDGDWAISGNDMYSIPSGNVGIGTTSPFAKLDVNGDINTDYVYKIAGDTVLSITSTNNTQVGVGAGENNTANYDTFIGYNAGYNNQGNYNTFIGDRAGRYNTSGASNTFLGYRTGYSNTTGGSNTFLGFQAGYYNQTGAGNVFIGRNAGFNETGSNKLYIANSSADPPLIYGDFSTGNVGIGTTSPSGDLYTNSKTLEIEGTAPSIVLDDTEGSWQNDFEIVNGGDRVRFRNATDDIDIMSIWLTPTSSRVSVKVLEITGGDLVEGFDTNNVTCKPGTVMVIDSKNPGQLAPSTTAYDRKVAGIVSGAGGITHGIQMGKQEALDGDTLVALTGRVYCWADASNGPIEPGDLLTTSDMVGHAMKVTDYSKAQGAILGKAMSSLEEGRGLVLVLANLQ